MSRFDPCDWISLPPGRLHHLIILLAAVQLAIKERLMILCAKIHVIVGEWLLGSRPEKSLVLGATKQIKRIPPDFTFELRSRVFVALRVLRQERADVVQRDLF